MVPSSTYQVTLAVKSLVLCSLILISPVFVCADTCTITKVVDGDTIICGEERIRLIGIDTPEISKNPKAKKDSKRTKQDLETIVALGKQSSAFVKQLVKVSNKARLEYDVQKRDRYGRILAYVYLHWPIHNVITPPGHRIDPEKMELFLNATIIDSGYAQPMTIPPNVKYVDLFQELYKYARESKRGLWRE